MPRTKKNYEQFFNSSIHNPPEIFYYDDSDYIIYCNLIDESNVSIKYSRANSYSILTKTHLNKDYYIMPSKGRIQAVEDADLISRWINENKLIGTWDDWSKIVMPIIRHFKIPDDKRVELFCKFRDSTLKKLGETIKRINKILEESNTRSYKLLIERELLEQRKDLYIHLKENLKKERAGEYKFLYPLIRKLFDKLKHQRNIKEQNKIVSNLFKLGNFDNFKVKYYPIDEDNALKKIDRIRKNAYRIKAKSKSIYEKNQYVNLESLPRKPKLDN